MESNRIEALTHTDSLVGEWRDSDKGEGGPDKGSADKTKQKTENQTESKSKSNRNRIELKTKRVAIVGT